MLTEKDYCDYDTCVALKELGYKVPTSAYYMPNNNQLVFVSNPCRGGYVIDCFYSHNSFSKDIMTSNYIDAPTMWEAHKWLRENHNIHIEIRSCFSGYEFELREAYKHENNISGSGIYIDNEDVRYNSYEEALLEGIKEAVKILKEK